MEFWNYLTAKCENVSEYTFRKTVRHVKGES